MNITRTFLSVVLMLICGCARPRDADPASKAAPTSGRTSRPALSSGAPASKPTGVTTLNITNAVSARIIQDGKAVVVRDGLARLKKAPFALVFRLPAKGRQAVLVHALLTSEFYDHARAGKALSDKLPFEATGMAEFCFNPDRQIFVKREGYNYWHYAGDRAHRFDRVERAGDSLVCTRTLVRYWRARGRTESFRRIGDKALYLVFVRIKPNADKTDMIEEGAVPVKLVFEDPAPAP